ncbi:uncharacterized protein LOC121618754 [Chelmon rostratus]|uniref:uncharacterized protein LOC121618754 n=1 Tax=Chelmon rostratus TaxID=109905 RepID=UPI001BE81C40|nr:uncharacterized protein LOC121618754 [Chelmon rostratus]
MAAVRQRIERGAYNFAHKTSNRYLLKSQNKQGESAVKASSLSAGFLLGDIRNGELCGAENAADGVTVGASQDSCTRLTLTSLFGSVCGNGDVAECYHLGRIKECSFPTKTPVQSRGRNLLRYRSYVKFRRSAHRLQSLGSRCLCWGHGQFVFIRAYSGYETRPEPLYKTKTGYYDILEVSPTATQAQVKTAYYKQSFMYHPDRNAGSEEATVRFSEISEAYTVLGNKSLRRKYDRGLLSPSDLVATTRPSGKDTTGSTAKRQSESRRSVMGTEGRGGIFDFDKFFKAHYGEQLQREKDARLRKEEMLKNQKQARGDKLVGIVEIGVGVMIGVAFVIVISMKGR